ncbi:hypothetical protein [Micromonospora sp. WMMD710]|uniref:hypothetical protein n=1 Tax=Micromonospora sp. WMMD710 TaxID=3016085 RepID=UPI002415EDEB|nr:hypothetical protein [Micromonospora sp. WMMD710]MDG4759395.1 hypothetical protein [Micromonospora sp. WMMD710]
MSHPYPLAGRPEQEHSIEWEDQLPTVPEWPCNWPTFVSKAKFFGDRMIALRGQAEGLKASDRRTFRETIIEPPKGLTPGDLKEVAEVTALAFRIKRTGRTGDGEYEYITSDWGKADRLAHVAAELAVAAEMLYFEVINKANYTPDLIAATRQRTLRETQKNTGRFFSPRYDMTPALESMRKSLGLIDTLANRRQPAAVPQAAAPQAANQRAVGEAQRAAAQAAHMVSPLVAEIANSSAPAQAGTRASSTATPSTTATRPASAPSPGTSRRPRS